MGDIPTRVATVEEAAAMECAGLRPQFEFRVNAGGDSAWVDLVGIDPATGQPARAIQFIRALPRAGGFWMFDPRETVNARIIEQALGTRFPEFVITGP